MEAIKINASKNIAERCSSMPLLASLINSTLLFPLNKLTVSVEKTFNTVIKKYPQQPQHHWLI